MDLYLAIVHPDTVRMFYEKTGIKANFLISYAYQEGNISKLVKTYRHMIKKLAIDSGAYSVITGKKKIPLREYIEFLLRYGDYFDICFSLDDRFDDAEHNLENQMQLENALRDKLWKPIPVIHDFEDPYKEFELYVGLGHDYVAIGSMGARKKVPQEVIAKIKENYPEIKTHLFGDLNLAKLKKFRPFSADSAGWAHQGGKGGSIMYWRRSENKAYIYNVGAIDSTINQKYHLKNSSFYDEIMHFIEPFGFTYPSLVSSANDRWVLNMYFFTQVEDYLTNLKAVEPEKLPQKTSKRRTKK